MKKNMKLKVGKPFLVNRVSVRTTLRFEGKFLHGTRGKPNNGPRGNRKY